MDEQRFTEEAMLVLQEVCTAVLQKYEYCQSNQHTYFEIACECEAWMQHQRSMGKRTLNTMHGWAEGIIIDGFIVSVGCEGMINVVPTGPYFNLGYMGTLIWEGSLNKKEKVKNEEENDDGDVHLGGWGWVPHEDGI
jgi:hypothetical protein